MPRFNETTSRTAPRTRKPARSSRPSARARVGVAHDGKTTGLTLTLPRLAGRELEDAVKSLEVFAEMLELRRSAPSASR